MRPSGVLSPVLMPSFFSQRATISSEPRSMQEMFVHTDITEAPWNVVESDDKRRARINMIAHLLSTIPYHDVKEPKIKLPKRPASQGYVRTPRELENYVPDHAGTLAAEVPKPVGNKVKP